MKSYSLQHIVDHARKHSPFYGHLFAGFGASVTSVEDLPITDQSAYWQANSLVDNRLLTGKLEDGIVFKSGGTTGNPKYSAFSREEWNSFTSVFGAGMAAGGLGQGERVANLFYGGGLYASFLFIHGSLEKSGASVVEFPLGGASDFDEILRLTQEFEVTTWAGVPTLLLSLIKQIKERSLKPADLPLKKLLYGGEAIYPDQVAFIRQAFPDMLIRSIGYASVDAGLLGYADFRDPDGIHRVFRDATVVEIVDDATGKPIQSPGVPGRLIVTNLTRLLMPVIRYPAGDCAEWVDPPDFPDGDKTGRRFKLTGRSDEAARVGPVSIYYGDVEKVLHLVLGNRRLFGFQMILSHDKQCDHLSLRVAADIAQQDTDLISKNVLLKLFHERKMLEQWMDQGKVGPVVIEWVSLDHLERNERTGKLRRIIDRRLK